MITVPISPAVNGMVEIFAVEVLPGFRFPEILGFQQDTLHGVFIVP
jgi:hypothetical protein